MCQKKFGNFFLCEFLLWVIYLVTCTDYNIQYWDTRATEVTSEVGQQGWGAISKMNMEMA